MTRRTRSSWTSRTASTWAVWATAALLATLPSHATADTPDSTSPTTAEATDSTETIATTATTATTLTAEQSARLAELIESGHRSLRDGRVKRAFDAFHEADDLASHRSFDAAFGLAAALRALPGASNVRRALEVSDRLADLAATPIERASAYELRGLLLYEQAYYSGSPGYAMPADQRLETFRRAAEELANGLEHADVSTLHLRYAFARLQQHLSSGHFGRTSDPRGADRGDTGSRGTIDDITAHIARAREIGVPESLAGLTERAECMIERLSGDGEAPMPGHLPSGDGSSRPRSLELDEERLRPEGSEPRRPGEPVLERPTRVSSPPPEIPPGMLWDGKAGFVEIQSVIDVSGRVRCAWPTLGSTETFDRAALDAIDEWRFEPARVDGVPTPVFYVVSVGFGERGSSLMNASMAHREWSQEAAVERPVPARQDPARQDPLAGEELAALHEARAKVSTASSFAEVLDAALSLRRLGHLDESLDVARHAERLAATDTERARALDLIAFDLHDLAREAGALEDPRWRASAEALTRAADLTGPSASRSIDQAILAARLGDFEAMIEHRKTAQELEPAASQWGRILSLPRQDRDGFFIPSGILVAASPIESPSPPTPGGARRTTIERAVMAMVTIGVDGRVDEVEVLRSLDRRLDRKVVQTLRKGWRFEPATIYDRPVPVRQPVTVRFAPSLPETTD